MVRFHTDINVQNQIYQCPYILLISSFETVSSFGSTKERISQNLVLGGGFLYTITPFQIFLNVLIPSFSSGALCKFWFLIMVQESCLSIVEVLVKASGPLEKRKLVALSILSCLIDKTVFFLSSFLKLPKPYEWLILFK